MEARSLAMETHGNSERLQQVEPMKWIESVLYSLFPKDIFALFVSISIQYGSIYLSSDF